MKGNVQETTISPYTHFNKWLSKRIKANRFHFMKNMDIENWPAGKYLEYKGYLYIPLQIDWPEGRDYGILYVKLVGTVRKLQSGPSTDIVPLNAQQIKVQVSHEIKKKKAASARPVKSATRALKIS